MAERSLHHLNYGHTGTATFDLENGEWGFAKTWSKTQFHQIIPNRRIAAPSTELIPPSMDLPTSTPSTLTVHIKEHVKELAQKYPEVATTTEFVPSLAVTSTAILSTSSTYDPLVGDLFSIGSIKYHKASTQHARRAAAMVAGDGGNILRLVLFFKEAQSWTDNTRVWLEGETLKNTETGYWNEEAAPIRQICFPLSQKGGSLLAVRLPTKTVIFWPIFDSRRLPARPSPFFNLQPSCVDPQPVCTLDMEQSGGSPHVDVSFNPDYHFQFGIVDQDQMWSVWELKRHLPSPKISVSRLVRGPISAHRNGSLIGGDGWARIRWVGDVNTILVCNRRQLSIFNLQGGDFTQLACPELFSPRSSDWILDVKPHPKHRNRFFILTSSAIFLMAVTTYAEAQNANAGNAGAEVVVSRKHYRGAEDFTLSINVDDLCLDEGLVDETPVSHRGEVAVLMHSRLNHLVQLFTFCDASSDSFAAASSTDPTLFSFQLDGTGCFMHFKIDPLKLEGLDKPDASGLGQSYHSRGLRFFKLLVARSDLSLHELMLFSSESRANAISTLEVVEAPSRRKTLRPRMFYAERGREFADDLDDFVVLEGVRALGIPSRRSSSQIRRFAHNQQSEATSTSLADFGILYDCLGQPENDAESEGGNLDVPLIAQRLMSIFADESEFSRLPRGTLLEFAKSRIKVPDIDEASKVLQALTTMEGQSNVANIDFIASAKALHMAGFDELTIANLYDTLLDNWIAPLADDIPIHVRQQKERLARRIATEVLLASTRIWQSETHAPPPQFHLGLNQDSKISLPVLPSRPALGDPQSSELPSSQPLPLLSSSSLPTSSQPMSSPLASPLPPTVVSEPLGRLAQHFRFKDDDVEPSNIPNNVNELLSHWQLGSDPRTYEWELTERTFRTEALEDASQEEIEKARRRKERREKRQRRENELIRSQNSSQPLVLLQSQLPQPARSSPGPAISGIGGSSQVSSQVYPHVPPPGPGLSVPSGLDQFTAQSQVEPGRFGGRPEKKKKKKRLGGF